LSQGGGAGPAGAGTGPGGGSSGASAGGGGASAGGGGGASAGGGGWSCGAAAGAFFDFLAKVLSPCFFLCFLAEIKATKRRATKAIFRKFISTKRLSDNDYQM